ncbi:MAG: DUF5615 family PIN-like protein [Bryobacteraceae bacterium]
MRLLADERFPGPLVDILRASDHDVLWARTDCMSWKDTQLLDLTEVESRIVFTLDKDFFQIVRQRKAPLRWAGVVLFRIHPATVARLTPIGRAIVESATDWRGQISIVTIDQIQLYPCGRG